MSIDIVDILSKLNKAALFFFLATLAFLAYEFYLFRKERAKKAKLKVPTFGSVSTSLTPPVIQKSAPKAQFAPSPIKKKSKKAVVILATSVVALGLIGAIAFRLNSTSEQEASVAPANPRAADETAPTDLTNTASSSAQPDSTATESSQLVAETGTLTPTSGPEASSSPLLAAAATATPTETVPTSTIAPTVTSSSDSSSSSSATIAPTADAEPTAVTTLPVTADNTSISYTLFIFLAATITFFVAFLF